MDDVFRELDLLTLDIVNRLDSCSFEELEHFVDERGRLLELLQHAQPPLTAEHHDAVRSILVHDQAIVARMELLRDEAKAELSKFSNAHRTRDAYGAMQQPDSLFVDQRK